MNLIGMILAAGGQWTYPRRYSGASVLGNLLVAILMRNELFGRCLYLTVNTLFAKVCFFCFVYYTALIPVQWPPLRFRLACTSVLQHLGGIHSGCATSGFLWLVFRMGIILTHSRDYHVSIVAMGVITAVSVAFTIVAAFPWIRNTHHKCVDEFGM